MDPLTLGRRSFLAATAGSLAANPAGAAEKKFPVVAVASANGRRATRRAFERISAGADTLEAAVAGVTLIEDDPNELGVGYGGLPNEEGTVQLDAAVMHGPTHRAGAVAALRNIRTPREVPVTRPSSAAMPAMTVRRMRSSLPLRSVVRRWMSAISRSSATASASRVRPISS